MKPRIQWLLEIALGWSFARLGKISRRNAREVEGRARQYVVLNTRFETWL
jgi:hypothetical protein